MREGWEYKKLGQVCTSDLGKTLNKSKDRGELHPYLCSINILWDKIDLSTLKQACFEAGEQEKYTVRKGDLLVCEGGDTGRSAIWDRDETILYQNALHRLRFHDSVFPKFVLFYLMYLKDIGEIDNKYSKGVTIKHLVKKALLSIPLPLPPKPTQLSIVSELDKINELIRIKKEQLKDYDTLAQSIFYEMFGDPVENEKGWEVKKLGEVSTYPKERIAINQICPNQYIGVENLIKDRGGVRFSDNLPKADVAIAYKENDILLGNIRPYLKKIWLADKVGGASGDVVIIRIKERSISPLFLFKLLSSDQFFEYDNTHTKGAKMPRGDRKIIAKFGLILPPLSLQQSFAHKIEQIERQKAEVQKTITDLETLLAARMQYWFD